MADTKIEWTDKVWNPVTGCSKVSQGCKNCYAEGIAKRFWGDRKFTDVQCHHERLEEPIHWRKPARVFVNSMSDLFHEDVFEKFGESFVDEVFAIMAATPHHTYQILTKRPAAMREYLLSPRRDIYVEHSLETIYGEHGWCPPEFTWPLPSVWLGVSVEDQKTADERVPLLLETPAAVHFVSCEPLLGPVDLTCITPTTGNYSDMDALKGWAAKGPIEDCDQFEGLPKLDWVIVGGESGRGARPMYPDWARDIRGQCQAANVPFFFKQWGEWIARFQWIASGNHLGDVPNRSYVNSKPIENDQVYRVGKALAGSLLDGVEHKAYPTGRSAA